MDQIWPVDKAVPNAGGRRHRNHTVYNNECKGGRYGICLYFSEGSAVHDNRTENKRLRLACNRQYRYSNQQLFVDTDCKQDANDY